MALEQNKKDFTKKLERLREVLEDMENTSRPVITSDTPEDIADYMLHVKRQIDVVGFAFDELEREWNLYLSDTLNRLLDNEA